MNLNCTTFLMLREKRSKKYMKGDIFHIIENYLYLYIISIKFHPCKTRGTN